MQKPRSSPSNAVLAIRDDNSLRCCCGSLLARLVNGGVELKCRRCKRQIVIPLDSEDALNQPTQRD